MIYAWKNNEILTKTNWNKLGILTWRKSVALLSSFSHNMMQLFLLLRNSCNPKTNPETTSICVYVLIFAWIYFCKLLNHVPFLFFPSSPPPPPIPFFFYIFFFYIYLLFFPLSLGGISECWFDAQSLFRQQCYISAANEYKLPKKSHLIPCLFTSSHSHFIHRFRMSVGQNESCFLFWCIRLFFPSQSRYSFSLYFYLPLLYN